MWKGRDQASWSLFFFNLINKSLILHFVMLREEEEEGRKVSHRISPGNPGVTTGALCPACLHVTPGIEYWPSRLAAEVFLTAQSSLRSWKSKEVSSRLFLGLEPVDLARTAGTRAGPAEYRRGQSPARCGSRGRTRLARNPPPTRGLQSVVPATELEAEQKAPCGGQPPATQ